MALDTDLCFIREDSGMFDDTERRSEGEWYRHDVNIDFPFSNLPQGEVNCYPYATFEIKLDLAPNEHEPQWVIDLEESGLLEEAYQFSKFVHGMAILFDTRVPLLPYWLAQIDDDNSKLLPILPSQRPSVGKKTHKETNSASREETSDNQPDTEAGPSTSKPNERTSLLGNQKATKSYMGSDTTSQQAKDMEEHNQLSAYKQFAEIAQRFFGRKQTITDNLEPPVILPPGVKIPKKIVTPLKVEPKVFFANERTYFSWMQFGTMLSTFSLALFNSGDAVGKISGIVYTLVALSTLIYGGGLYYRRRELIRARAAGPYEEIVGPTVICFALLLAVGLNAFLKINVNAPTLYYFFQKEGMMI
jgi:uncharacterized membrane protein YidH (DUF202 family)